VPIDRLAELAPAGAGYRDEFVSEVARVMEYTAAYAV